VGMCRIGLAESSQFQEYDWEGVGHGHYCVKSNGLVISHSDGKVNNRWKSFEFNTGIYFILSMIGRKGN
jgi:hypothetical protein